MRNAVVLMLVAGGAFSASAAASWFLQSQRQHPGGGENAEAQIATATADVPDSEAAGDQPVAVRPRPVSVEEVLRFGLGLRKREEQLNEREKVLQTELARLELARADIRGEQQQIESLNVRVQGQAEACQALLNEIQDARQRLAAEREQARKQLDEFDAARLVTDEQELQNIKRMSEWFQGMEPEKAAGALKELANNGKTDLAVKLLSNFEERDAAKILSALDDYALMAELAERFKDLKRPVKNDSRRR